MECPKKTWHFVITHTQLLRRPAPFIFHCTWLSQYCWPNRLWEVLSHYQVSLFHKHTLCSIPWDSSYLFRILKGYLCGGGGALHWRPALINLWGRRGWLTGTKSRKRRVINDALYRTVRKSANNQVLHPSKQPEERILTTVFNGNGNFLP